MSPLAQDSLVHAAVVVIVVIAASLLALAGKIGGPELATVLATALGYAAGRSGTTPSSQDERTP